MWITLLLANSINKTNNISYLYAIYTRKAASQSGSSLILYSNYFITAFEAFGFCNLNIIWTKLGIMMQSEKPTA